MNIFAHRGYSGIYPENTMTAFMKAAGTACYGIELDVQLTKDGTVVVIHDERVDRTTGGTGWVEDFTFAELQRLNANKTHPEAAEQEHIPSFEEYCAWVQRTNLVTNVELKTGCVYYSGLEEKTLDIIKKYNLEPRMFFSSFNPLSLVLIKRIAPEIPCGLLVERPVVHAGKMCVQFGFEYYHPGTDGLTEDAVKECRAAGRKVHVWTVNEIEDKTRLEQWGVDGIFTNFPEL
ncbi:MAG TPA: glycerophosphodiester phosphodiesterase [Treponema sp.]|nr:glycerophosphodiester phosphodiesterase [Treponema sp.]